MIADGDEREMKMRLKGFNQKREWINAGHGAAEAESVSESVGLTVTVRVGSIGFDDRS